MMRKRGELVVEDREVGSARTCPQCGAPIVYRGVGRRPVWCSARCRNDAALTRRGARLGAIEVRLIEVEVGRRRRLEPITIGSPEDQMPHRTHTGDDALRTVLSSPELVGSVLSGLERLRLTGELAAPRWRPVCGGLLALARALQHGS
jgi:hypothetical protein